MSTYTVTVTGTIFASIVGGDVTMNSDTTIILDVMSESFSELGTLNFFNLTILSIDAGVTYTKVINNGVNSTFSAVGFGDVVLQLEVQDDAANSDTTTITVTII